MFLSIDLRGLLRRLATVLAGVWLGLCSAYLGGLAPEQPHRLAVPTAWAAAPGQTVMAPGSLTPGNTVWTERTRSQLLSARVSIAPGERFWVGLRQDFDAGWHSYWRNPGDSGFPATLTWTLPPGAAAGPVLWPPPARQPFGGLVNYGHAGSLVLLTEIETPQTLRPGDGFRIELAASWLVCADICIPEEARLALNLTVGASHSDLEGASRLDAALQSLPQTAPWRALQARANGRLLLRLDDRSLATAPISGAYFFPYRQDLIDHAAPQRHAVDAAGLTIDMKLTEEGARQPLDSLDGVLRLEAKAGSASGGNVYTISAPPGPVAAIPPDAQPGASGPSLAEAMLMAILGGIILNFMPCVFPILSVKALGIAAMSRGDRAAQRREGLAYGVGVLACFALIAATMAGLRGAGTELGWGIQFQSPGFVAAMAVLMLAVGLNLSGVYELDRLRPALPGVTHGGAFGSFLTGALAVLVATPCTAPFMAAALGMAMAAPVPEMAAVILALGLGFATPFVLVAMVPRLGAMLPRPGAWMLRLRGALAFPMYASVAWLVWVLAQQLDPGGLALALAALVCLGLGAWIFGVGRGPWASTLAALAVVCAIGAIVGVALRDGAPRMEPSGPAGATGTMRAPPSASPSLAYDPERLAALRRDGRPVFVNMTAAWCITCLFNEANALASAEVRAAFAAGGVTYVKGDWTRQDPAITAYLRSHGRSGVPLYVFYPAGGAAAIVLPQILTPAIVLDALRQG
jgi:thiol:disulfide interchange protein DsbD